MADISKMRLELWEWTTSDKPLDLDSQSKLNGLNEIYFKYCLGNASAGEVQGMLEAMNTDEFWLGRGGGTPRFAMFYVWVARMMGDAISANLRASICEKAKKVLIGSNAEFDKQMTRPALVKALRDLCISIGITPPEDITGNFMNAQDHTEDGLEQGSSHYGPMGQFNMLYVSAMNGKLPQEKLNWAAEKFILLAGPTGRHARSREYWNLKEGSTFWFNLGLFLMWKVEDSNLKGQLKWTIRRTLEYLDSQDLPISVFAALFDMARWDKVKEKTPDMSDGIRTVTSYVQDGRIHNAPQVYLARSFASAKSVISHVIAINKGAKMIVSLYPAWSAKGDKGYPSEIISISKDNEELINGYNFYYNASIYDRSARVTQSGFADTSVSLFTTANGEAAVRLAAGGWTREIVLSNNDQEFFHVIDAGTGETMWHLVPCDDMEVHCLFSSIQLTDVSNLVNGFVSQSETKARAYHSGTTIVKSK